MTASTMIPSLSKSCGGCKGASPGLTGCSGAGGCVPAQSSGAGWSFSRPRFFSGQLLTEDDLAQLTNYFSAKDRLHNRFLFGEGVVCGLEVRCNPCGGTSISVSPGYALDGCGNDIVVPVAQTLDIPSMIRDLMRRLGTDCAGVDPAASFAASGAQAESAEGKNSEDRVYRLFVRYCEQPSEPMLPYTTDDPCASQTCEYSRIREGYSFELALGESEPSGLEAAFKERLGSAMGPILEDLSALDQAILKVAAALGNSTPAPSEARASPLRDSDIAEAKLAAGETARADERLAAKVQRLLRRAALVTRYDQRTDRQQVISEFDQLRTTLLGSNGSAGLIAEILESPELGKLSAAERTFAVRLAELAKKWCQPNLPREDYEALEPRVLAGGGILDSNEVALQAMTLRAVRERLRIVALGAGSDCRAMAEISAVPIADDSSRAIDPAQLKDAVASLKTLALRLVRDALFGALLPSCDAACDGDAGVLIACITVRRGTAVEARSLPRRFASTPATLRYWNPGLFSPRPVIDALEPVANWVDSVECGGMSALNSGLFDDVRKLLGSLELSQSSGRLQQRMEKARRGQQGSGGTIPPSTSPNSSPPPLPQPRGAAAASAQTSPPAPAASGLTRERPGPGGSGPAPAPGVRRG
jgi:hypothetical protein